VIAMHGLKPLRHPRAWWSLWWLAVLLVFVVCLVPAPDLPIAPPGGDKLEHFLAYFLLATSAVQIYQGRRVLWRVAVGLVVLGIVVEFAQGALTTTRSMDAWDVVADAIGVAAGFAILLTPLRDLLLRLDGRRA
jgi:VanZ family protein